MAPLLNLPSGVLIDDSAQDVQPLQLSLCGLVLPFILEHLHSSRSKTRKLAGGAVAAPTGVCRLETFLEFDHHLAEGSLASRTQTDVPSELIFSESPTWKGVKGGTVRRQEFSADGKVRAPRSDQQSLGHGCGVLRKGGGVIQLRKMVSSWVFGGRTLKIVALGENSSNPAPFQRL